MDGNTGFHFSVSKAPDIDWRVASIDTVLFGLLDRLRREKRSLTIRERQRVRTDARPHCARSPWWA